MEPVFVVADRHFLSQRGMVSLIREYWPDVKVYLPDCKQELVARLSSGLSGVVIIDLSEFDFVDFDEVMILMQRFTGVHYVLMLPSLSRENLMAVSAMPNVSIISKDGDREGILTGLIYAASHHSYRCKEVDEILQRDDGFKPMVDSLLTPSEVEILKLIAAGLSAKEIAGHRCISVHTVITHKKNIFRKLEINTVHEACKYALRSGLIELAEYYI